MSVPGGFGLYALDDAERLSVAVLDSRTGRPRWRQPASPSFTVGGVGLELLARDQTVVFMRPVGDGHDGVVQLAAVDARSGRQRWIFSPGGLRIVTQPRWCGSGRFVCLVAATRSPAGPVLLTVDARDGRLAGRRWIGDGRLLAEDLYATGRGVLSRVTPAGRLMWRRRLTALFGATGLSVDAGWDVRRQGGLYVGWLGHQAPAGAPDVQRLGRGVVAAFDAATGRRSWSQPGVEIFCGNVVFDPSHPVWCRTGGQVRWRAGVPVEVRGLDVTLEGFEAATGRVRWSWHAGPMRGLIVADQTVIRTGRATYVLRTAHGPMLLDLDRGVTPLRGAVPAGWCRAMRPVQVRTDSRGGSTPYAAEQYWPCDGQGRALTVPVSTPDFAGTWSGKSFAWADWDGVHAVTAR